MAAFASVLDLIGHLDEHLAFCRAALEAFLLCWPVGFCSVLYLFAQHHTYILVSQMLPQGDLKTMQ